MRLLSVLLLLFSVAAGCIPGPQVPPTPDPFAGLAERAQEAFDEGLTAFEEGRFREALNAFEQARILSPTPDPRIDQMIERTRVALFGTPTPAVTPTHTATVGPSPTPPGPTPAATPTPVFLNREAPDTELGQRYFGTVFLSVVPGRNVVPPPTNEFFYDDQVGMYIEALDERLRLPFTLRIFDLDTGAVIANVRNEGTAPPPSATGPRPPTPTPPAAAPGASPAPTPGPGDFQLVRFWDNFVWYHEGGEPIGRYRAELYANGTMAYAFDYVVGSVPVAVPVIPPTPIVPFDPFEPPAQVPGVQPPVAPPAQPPGAPTVPGATPVPGAPPEDPKPGDPAAGPAAPPPPGDPGAGPAVPPPPTPLPTATFTATPTPTPAPAATIVTGGLPAGLDVNNETNRLYIADASGVVWTIDGARPTLNTPFSISRLPMDVAVDQTTGNLYISARSAPGVVVLNGTTGAQLATISLPVNPQEIVLDSELGLGYVVLPERQALAVIDIRSGAIMRTTTGLPQVTGLAVDTTTHTVYLSHLAGQVSIVNGADGQVVGRVTVSGAGLAGVATGGGLVYAVNTPARSLHVLDPATREVTRYALEEEPASVVAGETSGTVYVLGTRTNSILRIDPATGDVVGQVLLPERSGRYGVALGQNEDLQGLRARMAINDLNETIYVTQPEAGTLSIVVQALFPPLPGDAVAVGPSESAPAMVALPAAAAPVAAPAVTPTPRIPTATPTQRIPTPVPTAAAPVARPVVPQAMPAAANPVTAPIVGGTSRIRLPGMVTESMVANNMTALGVPLPALDWSGQTGHFFTQANGLPLGASRRGFAVSDLGGALFWSAYQHLGGAQSLGYPISERFVYDGRVVQLTQRALLQWWPEKRSIRLANLLDDLHLAGKDETMRAERSVPGQMSYAGEVGLTPAEVQARRLALLDGDGAIRDFYFAAEDPITQYGLPTSRVTDLGAVTAVRTQRAVLQRWKIAQPWARAGEVTVVFAGDLARDFGLFDDERPFKPVGDVTLLSAPREAALPPEE